MTFVITGVLESIEREQAQDVIQRYGGKVTSAVSKKTSYLIKGRDPGASKITKVQLTQWSYFSVLALIAFIPHYVGH